MPRPKQPPEYFEARKALNQHMHRHHEGATGQGTLYNRFELHDELHLVARRIGMPLNHTHSEYPEGESDIAAAHRLLREGQEQQKDADDRGGTIFIAMDAKSQERRGRRKKRGREDKHGQSNSSES